MCGRFVLAREPADILAELGLDAWDQVDAYAPSWNIPPTASVPVLEAREGERRLTFRRWGLVPSWANDPAIGNQMINARSETVAGKPAFRRLFGRRHCLVPADGYYEWLRSGSRKRPHYLRAEDESLLLMAALWDRWAGPDDTPLETFTILTTEPTSAIAHIHNRMPLILDAEQAPLWLEPESTGPELLSALLQPSRVPLHFHEVAKAVGSPANNGPELIAPIGTDDLFG